MTIRRPPRNLLRLKRQQLDSVAESVRGVQAPRDGWVRAIRNAIGMSAAQLAKRLKMSPQGVYDIEKREQDASISIAKLRAAAHALGCDVNIAFVPQRSLNAMVEDQALAKARAERDQIAHTMRLEAQDEGIDSALDLSESAREWLTTRSARLWD